MSLGKPELTYRQWRVQREQIAMLVMLILAGLCLFSMGFVIGRLDPATVRWHYLGQPQNQYDTIKLRHGECIVLEASGLQGYQAKACTDR
jgi:hypothetical protein